MASAAVCFHIPCSVLLSYRSTDVILLGSQNCPGIGTQINAHPAHNRLHVRIKILGYLTDNEKWNHPPEISATSDIYIRSLTLIEGGLVSMKADQNELTI